MNKKRILLLIGGLGLIALSYNFGFHYGHQSRLPTYKEVEHFVKNYKIGLSLKEIEQELFNARFAHKQILKEDENFERFLLHGILEEEQVEQVELIIYSDVSIKDNEVLFDQYIKIWFYFNSDEKCIYSWHHPYSIGP